MNKIVKIIFVALFFAICTAPLLLMPLFGGGEASENRSLSEPPKLFIDGALNLDVTDDAELYLAEHFAFRQTAVTAYGKLKAALFSVSSEDSVIIGKNGWLYFADTIGDYTGESQLSERVISTAAAKLAMVAEYVESRGGRFVLAVAPNKSSVVPNFMPRRYVKSDGESNMTRLNRACAEAGVTVAGLLAPLTKAQSEAQVYHKLDTHWNNLGAAVAADVILDAAGKTHTRYSSLPYTLENTHKGDLYAMLYPSDTDVLDEQAVFGLDESFEFTSRFRTAEDLSISTRNAKGEGVLCIFRDSFCNAMLPFLADAFAEAEFLRGVPYAVASAEADVVVIEIVERNLYMLAEQLTVFPAPERHIPVSELSPANVTASVGASNGFALISGELNADAAINTGTRVFIGLDGALYEAACVGERGFYAYLPDEYSGMDAASFAVYTK